MSICVSTTNGVRPKAVFHLLHQWGKWEQYEEGKIAVFKWGPAAGKTQQYVENRQQRTCNRCGKMQDEPL